MALPKRILVPTDFSNDSRAALEYALGLAKKIGADVEVLHVWEPPHYLAPDAMLTMPGFNAASLETFGVEHANREMLAFLKPFEGTEPRPRARVDAGAPASTILRNAKSSSDLIVMGSHGKNALERLMLGSVTQKIVAHASCPVLTIRAQPQKE